MLSNSQILEIATAITKDKLTVRAAATRFNISKSGIHYNMTKRLKHLDESLYYDVILVLAWNKSERSKRGGETTKKLYTKEK